VNFRVSLNIIEEIIITIYAYSSMSSAVITTHFFLNTINQN